MAIELATKFQPYVDEQFSSESKVDLVTNKNYEWFEGTHVVKVYKLSTATMNDYDRNGTGENHSRFGPVEELNADTEELTLRKDRSFTFAIDKMDTEETAQQLEAASALARQNREVVIPEVDSYTYAIMCDNAGTKAEALTLTEDNIYDEILKASAVLDDAEVPETGRVLVMNPNSYRLLKRNPEAVMDTNIGQEMRMKGVVSMIDGMSVQKVPENRLPKGFGFMVVHPCATVAPTKLQDYRIHMDPPGISGALVEGRVYYDAFVLENKKMAIYYQTIA